MLQLSYFEPPVLFFFFQTVIEEYSLGFEYVHISC